MNNNNIGSKNKVIHRLSLLYTVTLSLKIREEEKNSGRS